jgi:sporulation protein YlmC with PRC-barrel domain
MSHSEDLGALVAHLALKEGVPVYDIHGRRVGVVEQVVSDELTGIFEGLVIHTLPLPGRHLYAGHDHVAELRERGVRLAVDGDALQELGERSGRASGGEDGVESRLQMFLRRAWDWLSGVR